MSPFDFGIVYVPLSVVAGDVCFGSGGSFRRRMMPTKQHIRQTAIPAATNASETNKLAGNSISFRVAPHSDDDSS